MNFVTCTTDVNPCPPGDQVLLNFADSVDFASMGITPEVVLAMFTFGFAAVFGFFLIGYGLAIAIGLIRKL